jgi:hypothetical protein
MRLDGAGQRVDPAKAGLLLVLVPEPDPPRRDDGGNEERRHDEGVTEASAGRRRFHRHGRLS